MNNQEPYIVKFSSGRSSAMMLMKLLENNQLNPKRSDVIIFNNASAEHSATYEFVRQMKKNSRRKIQYSVFGLNTKPTKIQAVLINGQENLLTD